MDPNPFVDFVILLVGRACHPLSSELTGLRQIPDDRPNAGVPLEFLRRSRHRRDCSFFRLSTFSLTARISEEGLEHSPKEEIDRVLAYLYPRTVLSRKETLIEPLPARYLDVESVGGDSPAFPALVQSLLDIVCDTLT